MRLFAHRKLVSYLAAGTGALLVIPAIIVYHFCGFRTGVERRSGELAQEIYIWQRRWETAVSKAVEQAAAQTSSFSVLAAEVSWEEGRLGSVARAAIDYGTLKAIGKPVGLALRIGPYSGAYDKQSAATSLLTDIAGSLVAEAREAGVELAELQIDFDCAESKLNGYRKWVEAVREKIQPVPLTITVLPCWLKQRSLARLVRATDGFVLQVHSLEQPKSAESVITLCDSSAAVRWVEVAGRVGIPFRVALPTYGYLVAFGKEGRFIGLSAEGRRRAWAEGTVLRVVRSEPVAMAKLVQRWQRDRPCNMQGVIWYRLPVETDRLNWKWVTLSAIMAGRIPRESLRVEVEYPEPELAEIVLVNDGEADQSARVSINIECGQEKVVASDGLRGYIITRTNSSGICLQYYGEKIFSTIRAGERWKIGWIRFRHKMEVEPNVTLLQP